MKTRSKLMAMVGASALALSAAGIAFAEDLHNGGDALSEYTQSCSGFGDTVGEGQVGIHFVLTSPEADSGNLTADFSNPTTHVGPIANGEPQEATTLHFWVVIEGDGDTVVDSASTDVDGGNLNVSHVCIGEPEVTATPSFDIETEGITDAPSEPSTDALGTSGTSGPADGAWLLVVALGVLLASIVVLTPARAKSRR